MLMLQAYVDAQRKAANTQYVRYMGKITPVQTIEECQEVSARLQQASTLGMAVESGPSTAAAPSKPSLLQV